MKKDFANMLLGYLVTTLVVGTPVFLMTENLGERARKKKESRQ